MLYQVYIHIKTQSNHTFQPTNFACSTAAARSLSDANTTLSWSSSSYCIICPPIRIKYILDTHGLCLHHNLISFSKNYQNLRQPVPVYVILQTLNDCSYQICLTPCICIQKQQAKNLLNTTFLEVQMLSNCGKHNFLPTRKVLLMQHN